MPNLNPRTQNLSRGFAAFLSPPEPDVIRFTVGQPDFDTPKGVVDAAKASMDRGETTYTRSQGSEELCEAVSKHLQRYKIDYPGIDVVITPGCKQAILYGLMATIEPGDEVILFAPAWPSYDPMVRMLGGVPIHVPVHRENYHPDIEATRAAVNEKTKMIILNSPNNPTGAVYTRDEIEALVDIAEENDLWIMDDMIYANMTWMDWPYTSPAEFENGKDRTMIIGGWSKTWAMTGWRLGWITGPEEFMTSVKSIQTNAATHAVTFLMPAAVEAFNQMDEVKKMRDSFEQRKGLIHSLLSEIPGLNCPEPEGAFYALVDVTGTGMTDMEFANRALKEARVQLIPGSLMEGGEGLVRMSYANSSDNIKEGCRRLKEWLASLS